MTSRRRPQKRINSEFLQIWVISQYLQFFFKIFFIKFSPALQFSTFDFHCIQFGPLYSQTVLSIEFAICLRIALQMESFKWFGCFSGQQNKSKRERGLSDPLVADSDIIRTDTYDRGCVLQFGIKGRNYSKSEVRDIIFRFIITSRLT